MMYVSQIIMLYTLNLYSAVCQLFPNKTGRKKKEEFNKDSQQYYMSAYGKIGRG